ncbi:MAG: cobaltochelatase subunit CobN [Planctomycetota bacterium]
MYPSSPPDLDPHQLPLSALREARCAPRAPSRPAGWAYVSARAPALRAVALALAACLTWFGAPHADAQTPRRAPVSVAFVGLHGGALEQLLPFASEAGVQCAYVEDEALAAGAAALERFDAVVIQHVRDAKALAEALRAGRAVRPKLRAFSLTGRNPLDSFGAEDLTETNTKLSAFYGAPRVENLRELMRLLGMLCRGEQDTTASPLPLELGVLRRPEREAPFTTVEALLADARARGVDVERAPRVAVAVHATHLLLQQPRVVAALIAELDRRGACAFIAVDTGAGAPGSEYERLMLDVKPAAVIHTCHSTDSVAFRDALDAVHLHSMFFRGQPLADWATSPTGLAPSEVMFQVATQEMLGAIEPIATCGTLKGGGSAEDFTPIPERVARVVGRALGHARLRSLPPAAKKVGVIYYDREASRSSLMRGSPTGMMLNAPPSLLAVLTALREAGYEVNVPAGEDDLVALAERSGRVVGVSGPGEAEALADSGLVPLVDEADYLRWLEARVPAAARADLEARWGPAPGTICVVERGGRRKVVVPMIQLGNVVLMPQPLRGEAYDPSQTHDKAVPPPHSYLAAYFWLQEAFGADVLVHFGTHGSEFFLPGKNVGMRGEDWSDILLGDVPNLSPWVINNLGESILSKRRAYAVLIDHLVPPTEEAGLADGLAALHNDLHRLQRAEPGVLREKLRASITAQARTESLDADLDLALAEGDLLTDEQLDDLCSYLHVIEEDLTPTSLHRLGVAPADEARMPWLVHCGGQALIDALSAVPGVGPLSGDHSRALARAIAADVLRMTLRHGFTLSDALRACGAPEAYTPEPALTDALETVTQLDAGLARTGDEVVNLLRACDGRFVSPGPGQAPERNPRSVPTGRNMFLLDPREIPTKEAWEVGKGLAQELIDQHRAETGDWPTKVAFNIRAMSSFRDFGVMESEVLWMLGCEPVRDKRGAVIDVALIPSATLGRPRIDVYMQGGSRYNDMLADRAKLLDRAVRLAIEDDSPDNRVRAATLARRAELTAGGLAPERAEVLANARMFGQPPGGGNASYYYMTQRSGDWDDRQQLADAYFDLERFAYTEGAWGEEADLAFRSALRDSQYVLRSWADTTRGPTTDKYMWMHGGSLAAAVEFASDGRRPRFVLNDLRDMGRASLVEAEEALRRDFRVRALNRKWISGMMREGYAGADQLKVVTSNAFGWQVMRAGAIPDETFEQLADVYVRDRLGLGLKEFFARENPWALQGIAEDLLETARKGLWDARPETLADLATALVESRNAHGEGGGLLTAGNAALESFVSSYSRVAASAADAAALPSDASSAAPSPSDASSASASPRPEPAPPDVTPPVKDAGAESAAAPAAQVSGLEMRPEPEPAPPAGMPPPEGARWGAELVAAGALLLIALGFVTRAGGVR